MTITPEQARENLKKVRDHIATLPAEQFDMDHWSSDCGTAVCIGGWIDRLFFSGVDLGSDDSRLNRAGRQIGLGTSRAYELFYPDDSEIADGRTGYQATTAEAVRVLDHLLETGEVDWSKAEAPQ